MAPRVDSVFTQLPAVDRATVEAAAPVAAGRVAERSDVTEVGSLALCTAPGADDERAPLLLLHSVAGSCAAVPGEGGAPPQPFLLRAAGRGDVGGVEGLERICFPDYAPATFIECYLADFLCNFVAVDAASGRLLGAVLADGGGCFRRAYVGLLAVHPAARGLGVASALMRAVAAHAHSRVLTLHVESSNERALRLYWRLGYRPERLLRGYYTAECGHAGDAYYMKCFVGGPAAEL